MSWFQELRFGWRLLRRHSASSLAAGIALALALAACATVFSVVHAVLLEPLTFPDADRLVAVWQVDPQDPKAWDFTTAATYAAWRDGTSAFDSLAAISNAGFTLTDFEVPETPLIRRVTPGYFALLGVQPLRGRTFGAAEGEPGAPPVVILSYDLWLRRFGEEAGSGIGEGGDLGTLGLDGVPHQIVGVMPPHFDNPALGLSDRPQAWIPLVVPAGAGADAAGGTLDRRRTNYVVFGRLPAGRAVAPALERAQEQIDAVSRRLAERWPDSHSHVGGKVAPMAERLVRGMRPALGLLFAAVALVTLLACANVGHLLLARTLSRGREMAVRRALGASGGRLLRQLVAEGLVLTALAGGLGLLLTAWGTATARLWMPSGFNIPQPDLSVGPLVVSFVLALVVLAAGLVGAVPALWVLRGGADGSLVGGPRATAGPSGRRLRHALVVAEMALALVLLVSAGLLVRSFSNLEGLEAGWRGGDALTFRLSARGPAYDDAEARRAFHRRVLEDLETLPGVEQVASTITLPHFPDFFLQPVVIDGVAAPEPGQEPRLGVRPVSPAYFATLEIPLVSGRLFEDRDDTSAPDVAVVSRTGARRLWGEETVEGRRLTVLDGSGKTYRVVGVVGDVRRPGLPPEVQPLVYLPQAQAPPARGLSYVIRGREPSSALEDAVRRRVAAVDPRAPVFLVNTLDQLDRLLDWRARFLASLLSVFALLGLVLAASGLYAALAFSVTRRRREIGIRLALGAPRRGVVRLVVGQSLRLGLVGIAVGALLAAVSGRLLEGQLWSVSAYSPMLYGTTAVILLGVALAASWWPARRAARVDLVETLVAE